MYLFPSIFFHYSSSYARIQPTYTFQIASSLVLHKLFQLLGSFFLLYKPIFFFFINTFHNYLIFTRVRFFLHVHVNSITHLQNVTSKSLIFVSLINRIIYFNFIAIKQLSKIRVIIMVFLNHFYNAFMTYCRYKTFAVNFLYFSSNIMRNLRKSYVFHRFCVLLKQVNIRFRFL